MIHRMRNRVDARWFQRLEVLHPLVCVVFCFWWREEWPGKQLFQPQDSTPNQSADTDHLNDGQYNVLNHRQVLRSLQLSRNSLATLLHGRFGCGDDRIGVPRRHSVRMSSSSVHVLLSAMYVNMGSDQWRQWGSRKGHSSKLLLIGELSMVSRGRPQNYEKRCCLFRRRKNKEQNKRKKTVKSGQNASPKVFCELL